jgi:hypothetical protein
MTTPFYSSRVTSGSGVQPRTPLGVCSVSGSYTTLATLLTADIINMVKVPVGATIIDVILSSAQLDTATSNPSPALTLSVIDNQTSPNTYISASTIGQTGGVTRMSYHLGNQAVIVTTDTTVFVQATAGAATGANGKITLTVLYTMDV